MSRLKSLEKTQGDPKAQKLMADLENQKMLINIFRGMANSPAALSGFLQLSGALKEGTFDAKTREAIALLVAQDNGCEYCLSAHTKLGTGAGLNEAALKDARSGRASDTKLNAILALAHQLVQKRGKVSDAEMNAARAAGLNDGEFAEVVGNVVANLFTNYFNNMNQTEVDFPKVALQG